MRQNNKFCFTPVVLAALIVFIFGYYYWDMLPMGTIHYYDEYKTLDRINAFFIKDDWFTVYSYNQPNFKKPPLQYWINAYALTTTDDLVTGIRIGSYIFGLGLLIATGLLAYAINPANPYAIPAAVLILSGSSMLWQSTISAMLDAGAAFFFVVAVSAFILAIRHPKWWYLVAVATGLGALQKAPVGLVAVCGMLVVLHATRRFHDVKLQELFRNKHFRISAWLTLVLVLWWPVLQVARYGMGVIYSGYIKEILFRFAPIDITAVSREQWWQWIMRDGPVLWIPAIMSLFVLPYFFRKPESVVPLFLFFCFTILMSLAAGDLHSRYVLLILPVLAASFAALLARIHLFPGKIFAVVVSCALTVSAGYPFQNPDSLLLFKSTQDKYIPLLQNFARLLGKDETPVFCDWTREHEKINPMVFSYYASNGRAFVDLDAVEDLALSERMENFNPPYRGLCRVDEFEELKKWLDGYEIIEQSQDFVHWTSTGVVYFTPFTLVLEYLR